MCVGGEGAESSVPEPRPFWETPKLYKEEETSHKISLILVFNSNKKGFSVTKTPFHSPVIWQWFRNDDK